MGGTKRKRPIEFIEAKEARAVAFTKRREGLFSKASELCHLSDNSQIAIIVTPVTSKSNASFYTFGHSSVDSVVSAFLENQRPCKDLGLGLGWWDDESLAESEDPDELRDAICSISTMLNSFKQALIVQSSSASISVEAFNHGLLGNMDGCNQETKSEGLMMDNVSTVTTNQNTFSNSEVIDDGALVIHKDNIHLSDLYEGQTLAVFDSNINNNDVLTVNFDDEFSQELEQIIDFETKSEGVLMDNVSTVPMNQNTFSDYETVEDGRALENIHRKLYDNNIHLTDLDEDIQKLAFSDSSNSNNVLSGNFDDELFSQEVGLDQIIDFETNYESIMMNFEKQNRFRGLDHVDNLQFADFFNDI